MKHFPYLLSFFLISGCISTQSDSIFTPGSGKPIVDAKGVNMTQYELDLEECSTFAEDISTGKSIAKGAATGAIVGAVIEAITDDERSWGDTFEVSAVTGVAQSGIRVTRQKEQIVRRCLRGRGYKVLN
jgi:hypothetical protein